MHLYFEFTIHTRTHARTHARIHACHTTSCHVMHAVSRQPRITRNLIVFSPTPSTGERSKRFVSNAFPFFLFQPFPFPLSPCRRYEIEQPIRFVKERKRNCSLDRTDYEREYVLNLSWQFFFILLKQRLY